VRVGVTIMSAFFFLNQRNKKAKKELKAQK
jgi:hypothetical protein